MTYSTNMNQIYMTQPDQYGASPLAFSNVPELISCAYDDDTDPSPSPPVVSKPSFQHDSPRSLANEPTQTYSSQFGAYDYSTQPQPHILNSVEFTDLTQLQAEDRARWQHSQQSQQSHSQRHNNSSRSSTQDSKEAASNMRIRRRAQNRASQRAFRERKEKHVQHLEHELEQLESKHQHLAKSYTDLDSRHAEAQSEIVQLRNELARLRSSREGSVVGATGQSIKREGNTSFFDPFATDAYFGSGNASDMGF